MDRENQKLNMADLLAGAPFAQAFTQPGRPESTLPLPLEEQAAIIAALEGASSVTLTLPDRDPGDGDSLTLHLSREDQRTLALLLEQEETLARHYGLRGLAVARGRLLAGKDSLPLLLYPAALERRDGHWLLSGGGSPALLNPELPALLSQKATEPEDGWSTDWAALGRQLDEAIAQTPGLLREEHLSLSLFPLWAPQLQELLAPPAHRGSLAAGLETGTFRPLTDVPDLTDTAGEEGLLTPLPLDRYQMTALRLLHQGEHLIVSGHRGTGKTQLAAALTANAMSEHRPVLLAAHREADRISFLERMGELGLDAFCLHIPTQGESIQSLLHQYSLAALLKARPRPDDFLTLSGRADHFGHLLDRHRSALHTPSRCGLTPWELICRYLEAGEAPDYLDLSALPLSQLDREGLDACLSAAADLAGSSKALGIPASHPLSLVKGTDFPADRADQIPALAEEFCQAMDRLEEASALWQAAAGRPAPQSSHEWRHQKLEAELVAEWQEFPESWRTSPDIARLPDAVEDLQVRFGRAAKLQQEIDKRWEQEIFGLDALLLERQWNTLQEEWRLPNDPDRENTLCSLMDQAEPLLRELRQVGRRWAMAIQIPLPTTRDSWERSYEVALELSRWKEIPREWGACSNLRALLWDVEELIRHGRQAKESKEVLLRNWSPAFLSENGRALTRRWEKEGGNWGLGWLRRQNGLRSELSDLCKAEKLTADLLENSLRWLVDYQDELAQCEEIYRRWEPELRSVYKKEETQWIWLENARIVAAESHDWLAELTGSQNFLRQFGSSPEAVAAAQDFHPLWARVQDLLARTNVILGRPAQPDGPRWLEDRLTDCRRLHTLLNLRRQLEELSKDRLKLGEISSALRLLSRHQRERAAIAELYGRWKAELDPLYAGPDTDWTALHTLAIQAASSDEMLGACSEDLELRLRLAPNVEVQAAAQALSACWERFESAMNAFSSLTTAQLGQTSDPWLPQLRREIALLLEHLPKLEDWMNWQKASLRCRELGLEGFVQYLSAQDPETPPMLTFRKSLYRALLELELAQDVSLLAFDARRMSELLRTYGALQQSFTQQTREELFSRCAEHIPALSQDKGYQAELQYLYQANRTGGQGLTPAELIQNLPLLTAALFPCIVASPLDALRAFPHGQEDSLRFQYVVLEGADLLPASLGQAVSALGRVTLLLAHRREASFPALGKEASFLTRCEGAKVPCLRLEESYLLRHESLHWLDRRLYGLASIPSPAPSAFAIAYKTVVGQMDGEKNPAEAAAVAAHALSLLREGRQSLAIAAMTRPQRDLLRRHLVQLARETPDFSGALTALPVHLPEDLGSHRYDILLLSLSLAPNRTGSFAAARRLARSWKGSEPLSDALAACRRELVLFSSLDKQDWSKTGSKELTDFLTYAAGGVTGQEEPLLYQNRIQQEVCQALTAQGYLAQPGQSPLSITVAAPERPGELLLGILMDDDRYGALSRARERELEQTELLRAMGWNLCRLWSLDWLQDRERVIRQICRLLRAIRESEGLPEEQEAPAPSREIPIYTPAQPAAIGIRENELSDPSFRSRVSLLAERALAIEAPISPALLTQRVLTAFELDPRDEELQLQCAVLWHRLEITSTEEEECGLTFLWHKDTPPDRYTAFRRAGTGEHYRAPLDVSAQEAANAAALALQEAGTLTEDQLLAGTASLLGYAPRDSAALHCARRGLRHGLQAGRFRETAIGTLVLA